MSAFDSRLIRMLAHSLIPCVAFLTLQACVPAGGHDRNVMSTDAEYIADLRALLAKQGVPHENTADKAGMEGIAYSSSDEPQVVAARDRHKRRIAVKHHEAEAREYLVTLLSNMGHHFVVMEKPDGVWIKWFPESEEQRKEVDAKVLQHMVGLQSAQVSASCDRAGAGPRRPSCRGR